MAFSEPYAIYYMCGRIYQDEIYTKAVKGEVLAPAVLYEVL